METNKNSPLVSAAGLIAGMGPAFITAFTQLWNSIAKDRPGAAEVILEDSARDASEWRLVTLGFMRVVLQHIGQGYPLVMPAELVDMYLWHMDAGTEPEIRAECEACGLGLPEEFQACPHCRGRVGVGLHSLRLAARAVNN